PLRHQDPGAGAPDHAGARTGHDPGRGRPRHPILRAGMTSDGVAFTSPEDGDLRGDPEARRRVSARLGIPEHWATLKQVHGATTVAVDRAGDVGEGDALVTAVPDLPLAVFTADCLG